LEAHTQLLWKELPVPTGLLPQNDSAFQRILEFETMLFETSLLDVTSSPKMTPSPFRSITLCWIVPFCDPRNCTPRSALS
jgi:hypothetical protein